MSKKKTTFGIVSHNAAILSYSKEKLISYIDAYNDEFEDTWRSQMSQSQIVENPKFSQEFRDGAAIEWIDSNGESKWQD